MRLSGRVWLLLLAALAAGIVPGARAGELVSAAELGGITPQIVNGVLTWDYPSTGVLLWGGNANSAYMICSGTLIGCETFLTAGHCVCDTVGPDCQSLNPAKYLVFLQHAGFFGVSSIAVHPDYDFPVADVAVLKLASPVRGIIPTPIDVTTDSPSLGTTGTIAGFGRSGGAFTDYGLKRYGQVVTDNCPSGVSGTTSVCWKFNKPLGTAPENSNTCNGDSGGPLFINSGSGDVLAGITSGGTSGDCLPADNSYDARVSEYAAYIQTQAGADWDQTSCGSIPQVGEPDATVLGSWGDLGVVADDAIFSFSVPSGKTLLRVAMNAIDDGWSNFDLYVKEGSAPTTADFDCRAKGKGQFGFCEFSGPAAGTWYVLVTRKNGGGTYQLTATVIGTDCSTAADGAPCDDGNPCTENDICQGGVCAGVAARPQRGCVAAHSGVFRLVDRTPDDKDKLVWAWKKGPATAFGDPLDGSDYAMCVYANAVVGPTLVIGTHVPAGGFCNGKPCWKTVGSGFRYRDPDQRNDGIKLVQMKDAPAGEAKIIIRGKGNRVSMPPLPLRRPVLVQARDGATCWEATYNSGVKKNAAGRFVAKPD